MQLPLIVRWLINAFALMVISWIMGESVRLNGFGAAMLAAALIGILNVLIKPFLIILTLPLNVMTLGLFTFVINAIIMLLVSSDNPTAWFYISGFWPAFGAAFLMSVVSWTLSSFIRPESPYNSGIWIRTQRHGRNNQSDNKEYNAGDSSFKNTSNEKSSKSDDTIDLHQNESGKWEQ
jgi:putative membrane protein